MTKQIAITIVISSGIVIEVGSSKIRDIMNGKHGGDSSFCSRQRKVHSMNNVDISREPFDTRPAKVVLESIENSSRPGNRNRGDASG